MSPDFLAALPAEDRGLIDALGRTVTLPRGAVLVQCGVAPNDIYMPISGLVSLRAASGAELMLLGKEALCGAWSALGRDTSPFTAIVDREGTFLRVGASSFKSLLSTSASARQAVSDLLYDQLVAFSATHWKHGAHSLTRRVANRLEERFRRSNGADLRITHSELSELVRAHRPAVTLALQSLEGHRAIRAMRGRIRLIDEEALSHAS